MTKIVKHAPAVCDRINSSMDFHGKSYSYRFVCPQCGLSRRYNTNWLGNKYDPVCDGNQIVTLRRGDALTWTVLK